MSSTAKAVSHPETGSHAWNRRVRYFNSGKAVALQLSPVHSHHYEGSTRMESWVVQDGGLHHHARTTGFAFAD